MSKIFKQIVSTFVLIGMMTGMFQTGYAAEKAFSDVGTSDPGYAAIQNVTNLGYFSGYENGTFKPNNNITKTEALAVILRTAVNEGVLENYKNTKGNYSSYSDISSNQWYTSMINFAKENGIINSNVETSGNTFGRDTAVSRAQFIEMFVNAFGIEKETIENSLKNITFYDIKYNTKFHWSAPAANIMQNKLLYVNGYSQYKFGPQNEITRREVAWILNKFASDTSKFENVSIKEEYKTNLKDSIKTIIGETTSNEEEDDIGSIIDDILNGNEDEETGTDETSTGTTSTGTLEPTVKLSSSYSLNKETIPLGANGISVIDFEIKAGTEDLEISKIDFTRNGFSTKDIITGLAIFNDKGERISKVRDDSLDNKTAQIYLNTKLVIKKGQTVKLKLKAIIGTSTDILSETFSYEISDIDSTVDFNTFKISSKEFQVASSDTEIEFDVNGDISNPKIGETKEISRFKITGANSDNVYLNQIIIKANDSDFGNDFENFQLILESKDEVIATAEKATDKYVTFNLSKPYLITEALIEKFVVKADVIGGSGNKYELFIEETLDVNATNSGHGYPVRVNIDNVKTSGSIGEFTIEAGELTIQSIDATVTDLKQDVKSNELGQIKITNVQGANLELKEVSLKIEVTGSGYIDANSNNVLDAGEALTAKTLFDNVKLYNSEKSKSYTLDLLSSSTNVFGDKDIGMTIPTGVTTLKILADTLKNVKDFEKVKVNISLKAGNTEYSTNGAFYVEETLKDEAVNDITPSEITFKTLKGVIGKSTLSFTPLSNISIVRGAKDVVLLDFEVKADQSGNITVNDLKAKINVNGTGSATNNEITVINLYKKVNGVETLLESISGTNLVNGVITLTKMKEVVAKNTNLNLILKVSVIDSNTITGKTLSSKLTEIGIEDESYKAVQIDGLSGQANRIVTVNTSGSLTLGYDSNAALNKSNKTILAGNTTKIAEFKVAALNEKVDVEKVVFTFAGATGAEIKKAIVNATLYLDGVKIESNTNSNINSGDSTITFENLTKLIIPKEESSLQLEIKTSTIGYEKVGESLPGLTVTKVELLNSEGVDSTKAVDDEELIQTTKTFSISPVTVTTNVSQSFGSEAKLKITINSGENTEVASTSKAKIDLSSLVFTELGNSGEADAYVLYKEGDSMDMITGTNGSGTVTFNLSAFTNKRISTNETFVIKNKGTSSNTYGLKLRKDGVVYTTTSDNPSATMKSNENDEKDLGTRTY